MAVHDGLQQHLQEGFSFVKCFMLWRVMGEQATMRAQNMGCMEFACVSNGRYMIRNAMRRLLRPLSRCVHVEREKTRVKCLG